MARKFLYLVAACIVLVLAGLLAMRFWADDLTELALVPDMRFVAQPPLAANVHEDPAMWLARPGLGADDPAQWRPAGLIDETADLRAAVFFVHPTSYLEKTSWNAPLDDAGSRETAQLMVRTMASAFNRSPDIWAPRYRQATFGAFLTDAPEATQAIDLAYGDVLNAFDLFIATVDRGVPVILAGHSQGAFHLRRLLRDRVAGKPLARRIAAAYLIGWPVSLEHDLPAMGLPACRTPDQAGCVVSWLAMAEPADTGMLLKAYARQPGLDGRKLAGSAFLCSNPLTGEPGGEAPASANLGTLVPDMKDRSARLVRNLVPARCGGDGFLYIGEPVEMGPFVLPGNNYHIYDVLLFWTNLREDASRRVAAWRVAP